MTERTMPGPMEAGAGDKPQDVLRMALEMFDKAVSEELPCVSQVPYNSHDICKWFANNVRNRIAIARTEASAAQEEADKLYYLQDTRSYVGNCPMWWAKGGNGYTTRLDEAHRYTLEEAMRQHRSRNTDVPWPCAEIDPLRRPTVDIQHFPREIRAQVAALSKEGASHV